jgi:hypothetical protein
MNSVNSEKSVRLYHRLSIFFLSVPTLLVLWAAFAVNASLVTPTTTTTSTLPPRIPVAGDWGIMILGLAFVGALAWVLKSRRSLQ